MIPHSPKVALVVSHVTVGFLIVVFCYGMGRNVKNNYIDKFLLQDKRKLAWEEVTFFAKKQTEKRAVFFIKGINERVSWSFTRKSDRDVFVAEKFVPVDKSRWYEWYQRINFEIDDENKLAALQKKYKLDYYLTSKDRPSFGEVVFENSYYVISRI